VEDRVDIAVGGLLDRAAIQDLLLRYARGVDRRNLELVSSCFVPGATYAGVLGHGTIETAISRLRSRLELYAATMHFVGNQLIELCGDVATSETHAIAYHRLAGDERRQLVVGVRYLDELVRRNGSWLIRSRVVKLEWQRYDTVMPPGQS
jgi:hypothetical protein